MNPHVDYPTTGRLPESPPRAHRGHRTGTTTAPGRHRLDDTRDQLRVPVVVRRWNRQHPDKLSLGALLFAQAAPGPASPPTPVPATSWMPLPAAFVAVPAVTP